MCYREASLEFVRECPECGARQHIDAFVCSRCGAELPDDVPEACPPECPCEDEAGDEAEDEAGAESAEASSRSN